MGLDIRGINPTATDVSSLRDCLSRLGCCSTNDLPYTVQVSPLLNSVFKSPFLFFVTA